MATVLQFKRPCCRSGETISFAEIQLEAPCDQSQYPPRCLECGVLLDKAKMAPAVEGFMNIWTTGINDWYLHP